MSRTSLRPGMRAPEVGRGLRRLALALWAGGTLAGCALGPGTDPNPSYAAPAAERPPQTARVEHAKKTGKAEQAQPPVAPAGDGQPLHLQVGPQRAIHSLGEAARRLQGRRGLVEVDAGTYTADVAVWQSTEAVVRAVGGRVRRVAGGAAAEGKGIWVVRGSRLEVEGFDFAGARVPDANGAGIRFESGRLRVRDCSFVDNENGLLAGNDAPSELEIEDSVFGHNGHGDGQSHNLYVGAIARLKVTGSWFHHARGGHLLKSRAAHNLVLYNRLADGEGGQASYELEFPSGGVALVMGNLIAQSAETENLHIVAFGAEGYRWRDNRLVLVHNTLLDERPGGGIPLRVRPGGQVLALNNLLVGSRTGLAGTEAGEGRGNLRVSWPDFAAGPGRWWRAPASRSAARPAAPERFEGLDLLPSREPAEPVGTRPRSDRPTLPGALAQRP